MCTPLLIGSNGPILGMGGRARELGMDGPGREPRPEAGPGVTQPGQGSMALITCLTRV